MRRHRALAFFLLRFALLYGLLIAPWPGWNALYGRWFRAVNATVYASNDHRIVIFGAAEPALRPLDTMVTLANRDRMDRRGHMPARKLGLDSRGIGWVPTALLLALTLASPVGWRRRLWALIWGLLIMHGFILFSVGCYIWDQSNDLGLVALTPFWKSVSNGLVETLIIQLGASFVVPALVWLLVAIRIRDLNGLAGFEEPVSHKHPGAPRPVSS